MFTSDNQSLRPLSRLTRNRIITHSHGSARVFQKRRSKSVE